MNRTAAVALLALSLSAATAARADGARGPTYALSVVRVAGAVPGLARDATPPGSGSAVLDGDAAAFLARLGSSGVKVLASVAASSRDGGPVHLAQMEEVPYVAALDAAPGGARVPRDERVRVGLDATVAPTAGDGVDLSLEDSTLLRLVTLDGGPGLGTLTKPEVRSVSGRASLRVAPGHVGVLAVPDGDGGSLLLLASPT